MWRFCRIDDANVSNLILIITALCLQHGIALTRNGRGESEWTSHKFIVL